MSSYKLNKASTHEVIHEFSGKAHHFKVKSKSGEEYNVSAQFSCDCRYMAVQGSPNGGICSHILAVIKSIDRVGDVKIPALSSNGLKQMRRNECLNLVRIGNRQVNIFRASPGESAAHRNKKLEIFENLRKQGKDVMTEAIFETGGRADILILEDFKAIEIVHTEKEESIIKKKSKYPEGLTIEVVKC